MAARSFDGKTTVITGGAGGLGRALARQVAEQGARVVLIDLASERLNQAQQEVQRSSRHPVLALPCDITDARACADTMARVRSQAGPVDVLVNNAGVPHRSLFVDTSLDVLRKVVEVNFFGALHCTKAAMPDLLERRGQIIAVSSTAGFADLVGRTGYVASKHAMQGFFGTLRCELAGRGVHVLVVCPANVATGIDERALDGDGSLRRRDKPLPGGALAHPDDIAREIVRAACAEQDLLLPDKMARKVWWVSRLAPRTYSRLMLKQAGSEFGL